MIDSLFIIGIIAGLILAVPAWRELNKAFKKEAKSEEPQEANDTDKPTKAIRHRYPRKPTPQDYYTLFECHPIGQDILDDLVSVFGGSSYVRGGQDADRETCFRAGRKHVVDHILIQISKANQQNLNDSEVEIDD